MKAFLTFLFTLACSVNVYLISSSNSNYNTKRVLPVRCHEDSSLRAYPCILEDPNDKKSVVEDRTKNENKEWLEIWLRKGNSTEALTTEPLHHVTGFTEIDTDQYRTVVHTILTANPNIGINKFKDGSSIMEFGCGSGAFVNTLSELAPSKDFQINGIDYSKSLIDVAKQRVPQGNFWTQDARNIQSIFQQNELFDVTLSFSVFQYFDSYDDIYKILSEMVRVTKVGGNIIICDVPNLDKKDVETKIKSTSQHYTSSKYNVAKRTPPHLFIPKSFFYSTETKLGIKIDAILDESDMKPDISFYSASQWRYTIYATKVVSSPQ